MTNKKYPRILVINFDPFNTQRNNGMTMTNLFKGWPKENLAQIYLSKLMPDNSVCENYWRLSEKSILGGMLGKTTASQYNFYNSEINNLVEKQEDSIFSRIENAAKKIDRKYTEPVREAIYRLPSILSTPMLNWIKKFNPDAVYSMLGNGPLMRLCVKISDKFSIPIIPHFTDDWISTQYNNSCFSKKLRSSMQHWMLETLKRSPIRLTIGGRMNAEYKKRYGGTFRPFVNCINLNEFNINTIEKREAKKIKLIYIGGLHLNRWKNLQLIGQALREIEKKHKIDSELLIYTYQHDIENYKDALNIEGFMRIVGWVENSKVPYLLVNSDITVHVESFDQEISEYTKYSISTKIPECMMAGKAILAFGPSEAASIEYIKDSQCGITIMKYNLKELEEILAAELIDIEKIKLYGYRAKKIALEHHESKSQQTNFRKTLIESIENFQN